MAAKVRQLWDRRRGEPQEAFARFLIYRNLGPARTMDGAYAAYASLSGVQKGEKRRVPGSWQREAEQYAWRQRASAHDCAMLVAQGREVITTFTASLRALAVKTLESLQRRNTGPKTWRSILETVRVLNELIAPQAIETLARQAGNAGDSAGNGNAPPVAGKIG